MTAYLEGRLSFRDRLRFQLHLGICSNCRRYLRQMRATIATLGRLPPEPVPQPVIDDLLARFRSWNPQ